jgi:hypothetical protein
VTLVTQPPSDGRAWDASAIHPDVRAEFVPYHTFPLAGRRGTTVIDRSTAYPIFGVRAGRRAAELVQAGEADIVHGLGASVLGYARLRGSTTTAGRAAGATAPLVFNPQGLEEFGATDPSARGSSGRRICRCGGRRSRARPLGMPASRPTRRSSRWCSGT